MRPVRASLEVFGRMPPTPWKYRRLAPPSTKPSPDFSTTRRVGSVFLGPPITEMLDCPTDSVSIGEPLSITASSSRSSTCITIESVLDVRRLT